jgi:hypothetical protein
MKRISHMILGAGLLVLPDLAMAQDQDAARRDRESGAAQPLSRLLQAARRAIAPGSDLLDVKQRAQGPKTLVDIFFKQKDGSIVAVTVDGKGAEVVAVKGGRPDMGNPPPGNAPPGNPPNGGSPPDRNNGNDRGDQRR